MKGIDCYFGVRAEQTLRDAVRAQGEETEPSKNILELCPVGKKDWIAGARFGKIVKLGEVASHAKSVLSMLMSLQSHQRIRSESLRVFSVRPPVPVFKDSPTEDLLEDVAQEPQEKTGTITCPFCKTEIHPYNAQYSPSGKIVGCYLCRGESRNG